MPLFFLYSSQNPLNEKLVLMGGFWIDLNQLMREDVVDLGGCKGLISQIFVILRTKYCELDFFG